MYGAKFLDMWANVDKDMLKQAWTEDLAGLTPDEIRRGLEVCKTKTFPPTLPEFIGFCRPVLDAERAYYEAVGQMAKREGGTDRWSHPAVFWTASRIGGFDLRNSNWASIKGRWSALFAEVMSAGVWPEIPPKREALPAPGQQSISREEAAERMAQVKALVARKVVA